MLTTEAVEPADRFAYWREVICRVYVRLDAEPVGDRQFAGSIDVAEFGDVRISSVMADGQIVSRVMDGASDDCLVSLQTSGVGRVTQAGRTAVLGPGDLALYDAARPYELAFDDAFSQIVVQFPRRYLTDRNVDVGSAVGVRAPGAAGVGHLASTYLRAVRAHDVDLADPHRRLVGSHALDLVAMALAATIGTRPTPGAVRTYTRQQVLDHLSANLSDPHLSVNGVAAALGISTRSLQKLFADDEYGLGQRIRNARLARARQALADPLRRGHTVARIAADHGYADAAHFTRAFKATYHQTPRDYRRELRAREG